MFGEKGTSFFDFLPLLFEKKKPSLLHTVPHTHLSHPHPHPPPSFPSPAQACDKEGAHPKTHLMAKISIPVPPAAASLRSLHVPNVYPNDNAMTEAGIDWDALREAKELGTGYTQVTTTVVCVD